MLIVDGIKYELWTPPNEEEFEHVVKEHTENIFGEQSIFLDLKHKLKSNSGIGSIPDGYVLILGDKPEWNIVEIELSSHPLYDHIINQVGRFTNGITNINNQRAITNAIYDEVTKDDFLSMKLKKAIKPQEIYHFLDTLISKPPVVTIIIEKESELLRESLRTLSHSQIKVVEFQTYAREGVGMAVHGHLFEPIFQANKPCKEITIGTDKEEVKDNYVVNLQVKPFNIKYKRLRIPANHLDNLALSCNTGFDLETDNGVIQTKMDEWNQICTGMGKWYKAHPELGIGDKIRFSVIEPMKKYRLEIVK